MKKRLAILALSAVLALLLIYIARGWWLQLAADSLVCTEGTGTADVVVIDNLESNYLLFERAQQILSEGRADRAVALVPTTGSDDDPGRVAQGVVDLMAGVARLKNLETIPIQEREPISLGAADQVREFLEKDPKVRTLILVTPGFRSRRSQLVYEKVFGPAGVQISCVPVFGLKTPGNWRQTWHGVEEVTLQWMKLWYYRLFILQWTVQTD